MQDIKAIIFDLYGTLVHNPNRTYPYRKLLAELNLSQKQSRRYKRLCMTNNFGSLKEFVDKINPNAQIDLADYESEIKKEISCVILYPETKNILKLLRNQGYKLGLISNLACQYKQPFFRLGLDQFFDAVIFSCDTGLLKGEDTSIYKKCLSELKVEPQETLMVGDKEDCDVTLPRTFGMNAILIDRDNKSNSNEKICSLNELLLLKTKD